MPCVAVTSRSCAGVVSTVAVVMSGVFKRVEFQVCLLRCMEIFRTWLIFPLLLDINPQSSKHLVLNF